MKNKQIKSSNKWITPLLVVSTILVAGVGIITNGFVDWTFNADQDNNSSSSEESLSSNKPSSITTQSISLETSEESSSDIQESENNKTSYPYSLFLEAENCYYTSPDSTLTPKTYPFASNKQVIDISECGVPLNFHIDDFSFFGENTFIELEISIAVYQETTLYSNFAKISSERYLIEPLSINFNQEKILPGSQEEQLNLCDCGYCDTSLVFRKVTTLIDVSQFNSEEDLYLSLSIGGSGADLGMEPVYVDYFKFNAEKELGSPIIL